MTINNALEQCMYGKELFFWGITHNNCRDTRHQITPSVYCKHFMKSADPSVRVLILTLSGERRP